MLRRRFIKLISILPGLSLFFGKKDFGGGSNNKFDYIWMEQEGRDLSYHDIPHMDYYSNMRGSKTDTLFHGLSCDENDATFGVWKGIRRD